MALTVKQVLNAKPGRHSDGKGLYLLVKPSGSRSWVLRVQHRGRRQDFGLGSVAMAPIDVAIPLHKRRSLTLGEAREKARIGRELAKAGINPSAEWRQEEERIPTFTDVAEEYHAQVSKSWRNGKHGDQWLNTLRAYAFPTMGKLKVDEIDAATVHRALLPIWLSKGETARRVRQRIGVVLDYAHGKGWRSSEAPMRALAQLMSGIKQPKGNNFAAMPYRDVPTFMSKLEASDFSVGRKALHFLILTAARSGEVRKARWRDVDLEAREWRIPPENSKTARLHIVPLVPAAAAVLQDLREAFPGKPNDLVFPGLNGLMSDATLAKALRVAGGDQFTVHGFRSAFRDWAAETGFADAWAEAALAHTNPNRTESAYKRTTFFEQRRDKLMPAWASFVTNKSSNIISLAESRA
ncbi:tyrosine-type recombinase/integrase [Sphingomonas sp. SM33]|uniref:Tyrosine-type recombinase/integrase n=2 Tax=Sphingomonas telluris TaxID=2907998 RepID=A0ABS9VNK7_9SPHN|nr:integrase arm-type DNA-binding domain-containing protein [Sphingomonas telluris]MCH8616542.1 tyrosine-type recombinase/integrase [Sphingomonas telluris]